jgi:hypothetical protein
MAESGSSPAAASRRSYRGCSNILEYELGQKLGEGTFGYVLTECETGLLISPVRFTRASVGGPATSWR